MLNIGLASKGRIQDQTYDYLKAIGLPVKAGNGRSYNAEIKALPGAQLWLLPSSEIAKRLHSGELHVGITGHDLILETGDMTGKVELLEPLGFARADLVVAVPNSWIDVASFGDLREVFADIRRRQGRAPQVATKYTRIVRQHFLEQGISDFRLVADPGATEAAPLRGIADVIVDITTTGNTLRANDLKPLSGIILKSEAWLAASKRSDIWTPDVLETLERIMDRITSHKDRRVFVRFAAPESANALIAVLKERFSLAVTSLVPGGEGSVYVERDQAFGLASFLQKETGQAVAVFEPSYILERPNAAFEAFRKTVI